MCGVFSKCKLLLGGSLMAALVGQATAQMVIRGAEAVAAAHFDVSPQLKDLPSALHPPGPLLRRPVGPLPRPDAPAVADPVHQIVAGQLQMPSVLANFEGVGQGFAGPQGSFTVTAAPPDANMAVGPNHIVQVVNTDLAIFNKTGTVLYGPVAINSLWSGFGGGCQTNNDGDAIAQYDRLSDRWLITQFSVSTTPFLQCVAVSTTADPTGTYNRYSFQYANFPDYAKVGIWPDAYYFTYNMFNAAGTVFLGSQVCALDRARMLLGLSATQQCFSTSTSDGGLLPADLDGSRPPPAGSPNYLLSLAAVANNLSLWKFHVDWATPANSTFTGPTNLATAAYTEACGGLVCIPQATTTQQLDSLADRLMYRLAYRNFGDHEALVTNHSVVAGSSIGVRWYEVRSPGAAPAIFQQGTYAPDTNYRWMGSIAMDQSGNMALGFSLSGASITPQIHYTGRLAGDAAGQMSQGEATIINGAGAQTASLDRWGDYTAMRVDPVDNCTFWYTNQYIPSNGTFNWRTRIASFKFPSCAPPATSTLLSPSFNPSVFGQSVTFTATVSPSGATGNVTFNDGASVLCSAVALAGGQAQCSTGTLTVAGHSVTATYSGDVNNAGSTSPALSQIVNKAGTSTAIGAHTPNPSTVGSPIAVSAILTVTAPGAGTPSGTITVSDGTATCLVTLPATVCNLNPVSAGAKTLTATYTGNGNFSASIAPGVAHTVNSSSTNTALSSSANPSAFGQPVTFAATVTGVTPTGVVTFNDGASVLCSAVAMVGGQAPCITGALTIGSHSVTATYAGDVNNAGSASPALSQVVNKAGTSTAIGAHTPNPSTLGSPIAVSANVTVTAPGAGTPSGTITVSDGTATCLVTLPATVCNLNPVSVGAKTLTASYAGDGNFSASISPGDAHTVNASPPTLQTAVSRKVHGSAGTYDLPLTLVPTNPTTEPRIGPAQTIVFTFDKPIASSLVAVSEGVATLAAPIFSGNDVVVDLSGVTNQQYVTIALTGVASVDGGTGGSGSVRLGFLVGDVNQTRVVSVADLGLVNAQITQPVTAANYLKDVNANGTLTVADKGITNANLTKALPPP